MTGLQEKHRRVFLLLSKLCELEQEASKLRNELIEQGVLEDTKATMERLHKEFIEMDNGIIEEMDAS